MNTKKESFTPGPWVVSDDGDGAVFVVEKGSEGRTIADMNAHPMPEDDTRANAALIAAAPELLAALEDIEALPVDDNGDIIVPAGFLDTARAAIAKAKSE